MSKKETLDTLLGKRDESSPLHRSGNEELLGGSDQNQKQHGENAGKEPGENPNLVENSGDKSGDRQETEAQSASQESDDFLTKIIAPKPKKEQYRSINYYVKKKTVDDLAKISQKLGRRSPSELVDEILDEFVARFKNK